MPMRSTPRALAFSVVLACLAVTVRGVSASAERSLRLVVHNNSYSAFLISMRAGRQEHPLGQAPPDFSNTLSIAEPFPQDSVRFVARLPGNEHVVHTSRAVRLVPGVTLQWRLPANTLSGIEP